MNETKFKETEVGRVPVDWEVKKLSDIALTASGGTPSRSNQEYYKGNIKWFTTSELNDCNLYDSIEHISEEALSKSSAKIFPENTILMAMYGATIGKLGLLKQESATNQACCAIICTNVDKTYLFYSLRYNRNNIIEKGCGAGQPNISQAIIKDLSFPLPPLPEQRRIATTLSNIDSLISNLDTLIEKKRNIKQGTMQQLLTGKTRLDGFNEPWVEKLFSDIYKYAKEGGTPSTSVMEYYTPAIVPFAKIEDLKDKYLIETESFISEEGVDHSSAWMIPANSILLSNGATLGEVSINTIPVTTKQGILGIILHESYSTEFVYYILKHSNFKKEMDRVTTHGTMDCAYLKDLNGISLLIPPSLSEQCAIASILTSMDDEIAKLEQKREKYAAVKQGMMQQLLTGKIRLTD